jgi:hypothetical protein
VDLRPVVTRSFPITQASEAFQLASDRRRSNEGADRLQSRRTHPMT